MVAGTCHMGTCLLSQWTSLLRPHPQASCITKVICFQWNLLSLQYYSGICNGQYPPLTIAWAQASMKKQVSAYVWTLQNSFLSERVGSPTIKWYIKIPAGCLPVAWNLQRQASEYIPKQDSCSASQGGFLMRWRTYVGQSLFKCQGDWFSKVRDALSNDRDGEDFAGKRHTCVFPSENSCLWEHRTAHNNITVKAVKESFWEDTCIFRRFPKIDDVPFIGYSRRLDMADL